MKNYCIEYIDIRGTKVRGPMKSGAIKCINWSLYNNSSRIKRKKNNARIKT